MFSSKRALQIAIALGGCVPISAGFAGIVLGPSMVPGADTIPVPLDSHFRYLSGLLFGIGLVAWSLIPTIEKQGTVVRVITALVLIGGLGRLWSLISVGVPDVPMQLALVMELVITPLLAVWQYRVAKRAQTLL